MALHTPMWAFLAFSFIRLFRLTADPITLSTIIRRALKDFLQSALSTKRAVLSLNSPR
jgi:hypothetical protein